LRYHSRGYVAQLERNEAYEKLAESERHLAQEIATAAKYVKSLLPEKMDGKIKIDWTFIPSTQLGGDMFGYHWIDRDHLALYLLDVSGHGVGSSLLAVSAANVLSARSLPDTDFRDPAAVLKKLNDVFPMEKQDNKYFTMWYGVYHKKERSLAFSNAGHPDALLFTGQDAATATLHQLASSGPVVGMLPSEILTHQTSKVQLGPHARLVFYSDGVFEIEQIDGKMWQMPQFIEHVAALAPAHESLLGPIADKARELGGGKPFADDFSLVEARF
jgi:sigma-B regulation protein RsbU (phosphoserine phosphatase)